MAEQRPKTILTPGQRKLLLVLLGLATFLLPNAAYLWIVEADADEFTAYYQWMLVAHIVVGTLVLVPVVWFVFWHLQRARKMKNKAANVTGSVLTLALFVLLVTGLFMFSESSSVENRWAYLTHQILAIAVPLTYVGHRLLSHFRPTGAAVRLWTVLPVAAFALMYGTHLLTLPEKPAIVPSALDVSAVPPGTDPFKHAFPDHGPGYPPPDAVFFPSATQTTSGLNAPTALIVDHAGIDMDKLHAEVEEYGFAQEALIGAASCVRCHQDTVEQWSRSAHRFSSFNNPFYRASIERLRDEEGGFVKSQWCGGCHDPALMLPGSMLSEVDPASMAAQAGLTCLACHGIDHVHSITGNGAYRLDDAERDSVLDPYLGATATDGWTAELRDLLIRSKPDRHRADMLQPVFETDQFCSACHKVSLDIPVNGYRWLRGQNEFDGAQNSGVTRNVARTFYLPDKAKDCADCHMPLVDAPLGDMAAKDGKIRSHVFLGVNTALPHIRGDEKTIAEHEAFMKDTLRVDVMAVRSLEDDDAVPVPGAHLRELPLVAGERVELQVVVRNQAVGHTFPGGTLDSNESWIHLRLTDAENPDSVLFESGAIDPETLHLDRWAHQYRALFVDEEGNEANERNPQDFRAPVHVRVIGPGTADLVRYAFTVPEELAGRRLKAEATLRWRKFNRSYTEFTWKRLFPGKEIPTLPITDIASGEATFAVVDAAPDVEAVPDEVVAEHWIHFNDWGIASLLQGDTRTAAIAFGHVRDALPERVDGYRNLARIALTDRDVDAAFELLNQADAKAPDDPQTAWFYGLAHELRGGNSSLELAIEAFERARETFPDDREIHRRLAGIRYRLQRYDEALLDTLEVLRIDPEDREAHYRRYLIYAAQGDDEAADLAQKAYEKYAIDESAQEWTLTFRKRRPDVNLQSQMLFFHDLDVKR